MREATEFLEQLGGRVRQLRLDKGLSLQDLCNRTALSKAGLWQIERGTSACGVDTLYRLCAALSVSADWLLFGKETT